MIPFTRRQCLSKNKKYMYDGIEYKNTRGKIPETKMQMPAHLIFFAFSLMVSPLTKIPLPLYGSGRLHSRISAANCVTRRLFTLSSRMRVGWGVLAWTPSGIPSSTGWEKPTLSETNCWPGYVGETVVAWDSMVALYPTPTRLRTQMWPSETPVMWFWRSARVVPGIQQTLDSGPGLVAEEIRTPHRTLAGHLRVQNRKRRLLALCIVADCKERGNLKGHFTCHSHRH